MKTFIATISAAVLGLSSLAFVNIARADTFSFSVADGSFSYSDDEYSDTDYNETPVYIVNNSWSPPSAYYSRHYGREQWRHARHRGYKHHKHHKHHKRHNGRHYKHHR